MEIKNERDFRLDFCRGLALIIIFVDHIPGNPVANWTLRNFGFCDAAEVFVLISGISTYLAFGSKLDRLGFAACAKAVARRWSTIYLAHLLLLMGLCAAAMLVSRHFLAADYVAFLRLQWFQESPLRALLSALTLSYLPKYLDILPLYLVLMAAAPFLLALVKRDWRLALAVSGSIYLAAWFSGVNFVEGKDGQGWYFNPLAWQFLYTIGIVTCHLARTAPARLPWNRGMLWVALGFIAFGVIAAAPWNLTGMFYFHPPFYLWPADKTFLAPLRLAHVVALFYVFAFFVTTAGSDVGGPSGGAAAVGRTPFATGVRGGSGVELRGIRRGHRECRRPDDSCRGQLFGSRNPIGFGHGSGRPSFGAPFAGPRQDRVARQARQLMLRDWRGLLLALVVVLVWLDRARAAPPISEDRRCRVPHTLVSDDLPLPATAAAVHAGRPLTIVALGSSSTAGVGASSKAAAYPAVLERELTRRLSSRVRVFNRGVGGETIDRTAARIDADVVRTHPTLVVWQTGTNDLMRSEGTALFEKILAAGIQRMRRSGIDVVLMDLQYFPRGERRPDLNAYLRAIDQVGDHYGVPVLHRHRIMSYWLASGELSMRQMLSHDLFHMSDEGYRCLGEVVADFIVRGSKGPAARPGPTLHSVYNPLPAFSAGRWPALSDAAASSRPAR